MPTANRTSRLRQIVLVVEELQPIVDQYREALACGPGDIDPAMAEYGLTHEVVHAGGGTYVEICAPIDPTADTAATRFLSRGGPGGYMAVLETPAADALRARVTEQGLSLPLVHNHHGNELTQLHPREFGTLLEVDEICTGHDWHYPALEGSAPDERDGITAIEVAVADPAAMAERWAACFGADADGANVTFPGGGVATFVPVGDGRTGVVAVTIAGLTNPSARNLGGVLVRPSAR